MLGLGRGVSGYDTPICFVLRRVLGVLHRVRHPDLLCTTVEQVTGKDTKVHPEVAQKGTKLYQNGNNNKTPSSARS